MGKIEELCKRSRNEKLSDEMIEGQVAIIKIEMLKDLMEEIKKLEEFSD